MASNERVISVQFAKESSDANVILAWETGRLKVGRDWHAGHLIVTPERLITGWGVEAPSSLTLADLEPAVEIDPEIILLGTGVEPAIPDTQLIAELARVGIGLEIMSTPAACRTYNVLVHEHRHVAAALFNSDSDTASD